jgi:hypothetical protein
LGRVIGRFGVYGALVATCVRVYPFFSFLRLMVG